MILLTGKARNGDKEFDKSFSNDYAEELLKTKPDIWAISVKEKRYIFKDGQIMNRPKPKKKVVKKDEETS